MSTYKRHPGLRDQLKRPLEEDTDQPTKRPSTTPKPAKRSKTEAVNQPSVENVRIKSTDPEHKNSTPSELLVDPTLLADVFAKHTRDAFPDDSAIELNETYLPSKAFADTTSFSQDRIAANLPVFLEKFSAEGKDGLSACKEKAMPHTLVVTSSGMRTADLHRELRVFNNKDSKVGKLIAKHMKLAQNIKYLRDNKVGIAISTPARFNELMDADGFDTGNLRRIVVDGSHQDDKRRTIFTMKQTFQPLIVMLNKKRVRSRYGAANKIEILVF